jgi:minor extracellular protease Epr
VKKSFLVFLVSVLLFTLFPGLGVFANSNQNERVIVLFKEKVDKNLVSKEKGKINREYKNVPALAISVPPTAIKGLKNNPNILAVEQDIVVKVKSQTQDWGITRTEAPKAWESGYTGKGVKIAVVDTGIAKHDDLTIAGGASFTAYTASFSDDNGHGTHVAGIIGARNNNYGIVGIAHESSIYAVKVLDQNGSGYLSDVIAGIDWSITNKMDLVNLSLGTTSHSSTLKQVVDKADSEGILVVAASGNNGTSDGSGDTVNYPARYASVIAVAATDSKDKRASFSATGSTIELAAPGVSVLSTVLGNKYSRMSGTSMAAPYVAGNLALLKQAYTNHSPTQLRVELQQKVVDLGLAGKDNWFGYGLIQAPKQAQESTNTTPIEEPIAAEEPTVEEAVKEQIQKTSTTVTTDKTSYLAGEKVAITVKVSDENRTALPSAEVTVTITPPKGRVMITKGTTNKDGSVTFVMSTKRNTAKGTYQVEADTAISNYESSFSTTSFQIK